jgi:hypothetical protein
MYLQFLNKCTYMLSYIRSQTCTHMHTHTLRHHHAQLYSHITHIYSHSHIHAATTIQKATNTTIHKFTHTHLHTQTHILTATQSRIYAHKFTPTHISTNTLTHTHSCSHTWPNTYSFHCIDQHDGHDDDEDIRQHRKRSPPRGRIDSRGSRGVNTN